MKHLYESMTWLVKKASSTLPEDVQSALNNAVVNENAGSLACNTLKTIIESAGMSASSSLPVCQDTGSIFAVAKVPPEWANPIKQAIIKAVRFSTAEGMLRQNCVETVSGINTGDNTGLQAPQIHIEITGGEPHVSLMLKGGGSENAGAQYSLPDETLKAGRDMEGVRRCVLDAVFRAQGRGCSPGILGVCIGGDRASGYLLAKEQLFRKLDDENSDAVLAEMEPRILKEANTLGIGPMGLGGETTLLGVKMTQACRHPASYFVSVSYSCWATRRYTVKLDEAGRISKWL